MLTPSLRQAFFTAGENAANMPPDLHKYSSGDRLRDALACADESFAIGVLVEEACRIADRLEQLNATLTGDDNTWMRLTKGRDQVIEVRIDTALQESRQQATVLRQLLAEIRRQRGGEDQPGPEDDVLNDL